MTQIPNEMPEFIDTYSDDVGYVLRTREAALTDPLAMEADPFVTASTCRLFLYVAVGAVEAMVNDLFGKTGDPNLDCYLNGRVSNGDRVKALSAFLLSRGLVCDESMLRDFLTMRLIRHEITHSVRKEDRRALIVAAGFPDDTRNLGPEHLARFQTAYDHVLTALGICLLHGSTAGQSR